MINVALAGQPNCGKSTLFTMLSGVHQHVANYPGVTIEKKSTRLSYQQHSIELVDLPGTYSFSTFSLEEKVAKSYLMDETPDVILNVIDASCIQRSLYLTFQLLEIGKPVVIVLNMMDVAKRRGLLVDINAFASELGVPVIAAVGSKGIGKQEILAAILSASQTPATPFTIQYAGLESAISQISQSLMSDYNLSRRWLAIKLLETDPAIVQKTGYCTDTLQTLQQHVTQTTPNLDIESTIATARYHCAKLLYQLAVKQPKRRTETLTSRVDKIVLNRWCSFPILALVIFLTYEASIVWGYALTNYTWPYLAMLKNSAVSLLPAPQLTDVPIITELGIWLINSILALLNYIPIFLILFAIIAILEDIGYMPRIAFILDRIFKRYGLHGQSTLPLVLGGAFVGGCAVPGIMATKGIADEQARIATALTVPYMNCLAKVPFYALLLGAFFPDNMSLMMFFISTVTLFIALSIAKILTTTFLKHKECAPFIMELPPYHLPILKSVVMRACQRVWIYITKVGTIVVAVAVVLFVLLQFPGASSETMQAIHHKENSALQKFDRAASQTADYAVINSRIKVVGLLNLYNSYRAKKMTASSPASATAIDQKFQVQAPLLFKFIKPKDKEASLVNREIRALSRTIQTLNNEIKQERITHSFLGMIGRALEPATQWAGFDWRVNVAFLSSFAARESAVATIGSIYETGKSERAETAMANDGHYTSLHAAAMLIFMIFTPPCIAAMVVVKLNVNSYKLMLLAIVMPFTLGLAAASLFYTLGNKWHWNGTEVMTLFYFSMVVITLVLGSYKKRRPYLNQQLRVYVRQQ